MSAVSEIAITRCLIDPNYAPDLCAPDTTPEKDAIRGNWVRVDRNLNLEAGYMTGFLVSYHGFACRSIIHFPRTYTTGGRADKMSTSLQTFVYYQRTSHSKDGTKLMFLYARALSNPRPSFFGTNLEKLRDKCRRRKRPRS